ncbi:MAG: tripartite tricarboxylate transporter substrate binding protein [Alcaligenaceae bacterium]|nr:tripartite tricarboxylate transporter substrate binding protein [Alcaligenaceae bacterium]
MIKTLLGAFAGAMIFMSFAARADFPERPIQLVLPTPPGGVADNNARPVAKHLTKALGQPVVVLNKPGAGGSIAYSTVAKSEADGYTLLLGLSTISVIPESERINGRTPSFELEQLEPVALISADPLMLLVHRDAPWQTIEDLVEDARKRPGGISYASSGNYGAIHFPMEQFARAANIQLMHVPYSGGGPAMMALLGKQVNVTAAGPAAAKTATADGRARILAHWGGKRIAQFPDVPTLKERGYDAEYYLWAGLFAPKATPGPVMSRLRDGVRNIVALPEFKQDMSNAGIPIHYLDGPDFASFWKKDADAMIELARKIGRVE